MVIFTSLITGVTSLFGEVKQVIVMTPDGSEPSDLRSMPIVEYKNLPLWKERNPLDPEGLYRLSGKPEVGKQAPYIEITGTGKEGDFSLKEGEEDLGIVYFPPPEDIPGIQIMLKMLLITE